MMGWIVRISERGVSIIKEGVGIDCRMEGSLSIQSARANEAEEFSSDNLRWRESGEETN